MTMNPTPAMCDKPPYICPRCHDVFRAVRSDQRYCSGKCKQAAYRLRFENPKDVPPSNEQPAIRRLVESRPEGGRMTVATQSRNRIGRVYAPRTIKRSRRSRSDIDSIKSAILEVLEVERPMTCRQMFYQLVSRKVIEKTEAQYKGTVIRLLVEMRMNEEIPFDWIADNTRWVRRVQTYDNMNAALADCATTYRRGLWRDQEEYVEIWLEKDALAGVLTDVTYEWDVPLLVSKGYPSITFLQSAGLALKGQRKPCHIYQFGDHDPSGVNIWANIERRLRSFAPHADMTFERIAVTPDQIDAWKLPTRPTKKTDTRSRGFEGDSVDVDAIPPNKLRFLCESCITQHIDEDILARTRNIERQERESITEAVSRFVVGNQENGREEQSN